MTTIDEFRAAHQVSTRRTAFIIGTALAWFAGSTGLGWLVGPTIRAALLRSFGPEVQPIVAVGMVVVPFFLIFGIGLTLVDRRDRRDPRLTCPACGKLLGGSEPRKAPLTIATRNCNRCGKQALADPEPPNDPDGWRPPGIPIDDLHQAEAAARRRELTIIAAAASWVVAALVGVWLSERAIRPAWGTRFGPDATEGVGIAVMLVFFPILFGGLLLESRHVRRDPRLACPRCGRSLKGMSTLVVATGSCGHCGRRILASKN